MPFVSRTAGDVVSEILMSRTTFPGTFFLVEGDTDSKFFSRRIVREACQLVIAGSKSTVCESITRAYAVAQTGVMGVVDDDYDSLCGIDVPSSHVVRTCSRDLESLLLKSPALDCVLGELGNSAKMVAFACSEGHSVRDGLVKRALIFGKLRYLNRLHGWKFGFDANSPWRHADVSRWEMNEPQVIAHVAGKVGVSEADLARMIAAISVNDPYTLLHGRDAAEVLAVGLRSRIGSTQISVDKLCQLLRVAFDDAMAATTQLFSDIRAWEATNNPYRVLI